MYAEAKAVISRQLCDVQTNHWSRLDCDVDLIESLLENRLSS